MATIRKRKGKDSVTFQVRYMLDGKEISKSFKSEGFTLKDIEKAEAAAKKFAKEIEAKKTLNIAYDESNMRFKEYAEIVFKRHDKDASFQTKKNRRYALDFLYKHLGNWKLKEITATRIENLLIELSEDKSDQVLLKYKQILSIVLKSAKKKRLITYNPMLDVEIKISQKNLNEVKPIEIDTFKIYLEHAKENKKYYFGLLLMFLSGMRVGETTALKETDWDFDKNIISINKNRQRNGKIGPVKKGRNRTIPIHDKLSELYYEATYWNSENKKSFKSAYKNNSLLICNEDGSYIKYSAFREYLRRLDIKTGIKLRPHQLRHTFATFLRGMELKDIQAIGGWKDADTLINIYQDHDQFNDNTISTLNKKFKKI